MAAMVASKNFLMEVSRNPAYGRRVLHSQRVELESCWVEGARQICLEAVKKVLDMVSSQLLVLELKIGVGASV